MTRGKQLYAYAPSLEPMIALDDSSGSEQYGSLIEEQLKEIASLTFPSSVQVKLNNLMDKNTEGDLTLEEREELRALVELNELVSILKGQAQLLLHLSN